MPTTSSSLIALSWFTVQGVPLIGQPAIMIGHNIRKAKLQLLWKLLKITANLLQLVDGCFSQDKRQISIAKLKNPPARFGIETHPSESARNWPIENGAHAFELDFRI